MAEERTTLIESERKNAIFRKLAPIYLHRNLKHKSPTEGYGQAVKRKVFRCLKVVEQIQQNTYDKKNGKNTLPDKLISNKERKIKEKPIHKTILTGNYGTRPKERPKEQNCRKCIAPNRNPKNNCRARESVCHNCKKKRFFAKACRPEYQKRQKITEIVEPEVTKESDIDK